MQPAYRRASPLQGVWRQKGDRGWYVEFRGDKFCTGEIGADGALLPPDGFAPFVVDKDVVIFDEEPFTAASWRIKMQGGGFALSALRPDGARAKFFFVRYEPPRPRRFRALPLAVGLLIVGIALPLLVAYFATTRP